MTLVEAIATRPLRLAGIRTDGERPFDMRVHNPRVYRRALLKGTIGLGESYMDGDWDCDDLAEFFNRLVLNGADRGSAGLIGSGVKVFHTLHNAQTVALSKRVAKEHYDLGNDLYREMLDPRMVYTCGYFRRGATTLAEAQEHKLRLVCEKIGLKPGDRVLDIGCGFGSFAKFAAEQYGAEVVGITLSVEQLELGRILCAGLPVSLIELDYRDIPKKLSAHPFDHIVSIGMFEAVGQKNFRVFMTAAASVLKPGGNFLLHTIGMDNGGFDPWIEKYIFRGGYLPSLDQIRRAAQGTFMVGDIHEFGQDYDPTLLAWNENFQRAWPLLKDRYEGCHDGRFKRMWEYYLLQCAGIARAGSTHLWQIMLYKDVLPDMIPKIR